MIIKEKVTIPTADHELYRLYSNQDFYLRKGDMLYTEIIEANNVNLNNYIETNIPIPEKIIDTNTFYEALAGSQKITESNFKRGLIALKEILRSISTQQAYYIKFLCPTWQQKEPYYIGDKVQYNNKIYEVIKLNDFLPPDISEAFIEIQPPQDIIEDWNDAYIKSYRKGDEVKIGNHIYISKIENNTWSPIDFPAAWELKQ